jgi:hypothetical protein
MARKARYGLDRAVPHWVDTRLPAVWAGIPNRDMAMWPEDLPTTLELTGPKLFMVKANLEDPNGNDQESLDVLESLYPNGQLRMFDSDVPGHDFWIFLYRNSNVIAREHSADEAIPHVIMILLRAIRRSQ